MQIRVIFSHILKVNSFSNIINLVSNEIIFYLLASNLYYIAIKFV